jgi:hypothetical protein
LSHTCSPFYFSYFSVRVSLFCLGQSWTTVLIPMPPTYLELQVYITTPALLVEIRVSLTFCLGWPQTTILLIAASQVAGIIEWTIAPGKLYEQFLNRWACLNFFI